MSNIIVEYIDHAGSDLSTVNSARVSYDKHHEEFDNEKDEKLINYLAKHKHTSPFNHAWASFRVKAPVFISRQLVKHEYLVWNEVSRRYIDSEPEYYKPTEWRGRPTNSKQGSSGTVKVFGIEAAEDFCTQTYKNLLESGVAPEMARMILPQSLMTSWYWSGTLGAFAKMCNLRCKPDTQYEAQLVANEIDKHMKELFPVSWEALRTL